MIDSRALDLHEGRRMMPPSLVDPKATRPLRVVPVPPHPHPPLPPDPMPPDPAPDPPMPPDPPPPDPVRQGARREARRSDAAIDDRSMPLDDLVSRPVSLDGHRVGTVVDVVLNCTLGRVLGVDVVCGGRRRFLPWVALRARDGDLQLVSSGALRARGLSVLLSHGTRLSRTWHAGGFVVDRLGVIHRAGRTLVG